MNGNSNGKKKRRKRIIIVGIVVAVLLVFAGALFAFTRGGTKIDPTKLAKVEKGEITAASGKKVFATMFDTGKPAAEIIAVEGLAQITDVSAIEKIAREVMAKSPDNVAKYRAGNEGVFKYFVGQVMRETRGQANPQAVNEIVKRVLAES